MRKKVIEKIISIAVVVVGMYVLYEVAASGIKQIGEGAIERTQKK